MLCNEGALFMNFKVNALLLRGRYIFVPLAFPLDSYVSWESSVCSVACCGLTLTGFRFLLERERESRGVGVLYIITLLIAQII